MIWMNDDISRSIWSYTLMGLINLINLVNLFLSIIKMNENENNPNPHLTSIWSFPTLNLKALEKGEIFASVTGCLKRRQGRRGGGQSCKMSQIWQIYMSV